MEGLRGVGAANLAPVCGDFGAVFVGVRSAAGLVLAQGGEVVQHVKEADGVVTFDGVRHVVRRCAGVFPSDRQFLRRILAGDRLQRLETPLVERVVDHNIGLEGHLVAGTDGLHATVGGDNVRQRGVLVLPEVIAGSAVVEVDDLCRLLGIHLSNLGLVRCDHIGRVAERLIARSEPQVSMSVQGVVVGHRMALRTHEHALVGLASLVASWKGVDFDGLGSFKRFVELCNSRGGDLCLVVVFANCTSDLQRIPELWEVLVAAHVDEDAVRCVAWVLRGAGACGLEEEAVLATFVVHRRDDAFGGHRLTFQRRLSAGALDLSDRGNLTRLRLRLLGLRRRICWILRCRLSGRLSVRRTRGRVTSEEVLGVIVGVFAIFLALDGSLVGGSWCSSTLGFVGATPANEINRFASCVLEIRNGVRTAIRQGILRMIRGGKRFRTAVTLRALDQEIAARRNLACEGGLAMAGATFSALVNRPAFEIDLLVSRVVQLDEIVGVRRTLISATAVDLVDDDIGTVGGCRCSRGDD